MVSGLLSSVWIPRMGSTHEEKLFRYVRDGRLKRIRALLRKYKIDLSFKNGEKRTVLHVACLLGEHAIVSVLLRHGASREAKDKDGNTPLHLALNYVLQLLEKGVYDQLIPPLLDPNPNIQLSVPNLQGETPRKLMKRFKKELKRKWEDRKIFEEEKEVRREDARQRKEWNEKLVFELGNDDVDFTSFTEMESDLSSETFDEWADRIQRERHLKQYLKTKQKEKQNKERTPAQKENERREKTRILEEEHRKYLKDICQRQKQLKLEKQMADYELRCKTVFSAKMTTKLSFHNIPWPCEGTVDEMAELILKWNKGGKKYLKEQQIRWHPDRFLQKCGDRIVESDKERVLDYVKQLSQAINVLTEEE